MPSQALTPNEDLDNGAVSGDGPTIWETLLADDNQNVTGNGEGSFCLEWLSDLSQNVTVTRLTIRITDWFISGNSGGTLKAMLMKDIGNTLIAERNITSDFDGSGPGTTSLAAINGSWSKAEVDEMELKLVMEGGGGATTWSIDKADVLAEWGGALLGKRRRAAA